MNLVDLALANREDVWEDQRGGRERGQEGEVSADVIVSEGRGKKEQQKWRVGHRGVEEEALKEGNVQNLRFAPERGACTRKSEMRKAVSRGKVCEGEESLICSGESSEIGRGGRGG